MQHIPFTFMSNSDALAQRTIKAFCEGNLLHAAELSRYFALLFPGIAESHALHAMALTRLATDDPSIALPVWDKILRSNPQQPEWLGQALHLAWRVGNTIFAEQWIHLLRNTFLVAPPISLLEELESRDCSVTGSAGIHDGRLFGWTWQSVDELPQFSVVSMSSQAPMLETGPIRRLKTSTHALNIFSFPLPEISGSYAIHIKDERSRQVHGSPVVYSVVSAKKKTFKRTKAPIAIIIPVYADRRATLSCLGSVFASRKACRTPFEVVVVWDHGPNAVLHEDLQRLANCKKITLHTPPHNIGFIAAVNCALECHPYQSVVLLNADTLVYGNWLDRLHHIGSRSGVGTVTPFGTHAELLSFPMPQVSGNIARLFDVRKLDGACQSAVNDETTYPIPSGVGFCMYIPRTALDFLGGLDGHRLFRGYGEEVDFCLRAHKHGLKNLVAKNIFVGHLGERSFGAGKKALAAQNNAVLFARYPDYRQRYDNFVLTDPLRSFRERVGRLLLEPLHEPLHVCSMLDADSPELIFLQEEARIAKKSCAVLMLQSCGAQIHAQFKFTHELPLPTQNLLLPRDFSVFLQILERLQPSVLLTYSESSVVDRVLHKLPYPCEKFVPSCGEVIPEVSLMQTSNATWVLPPPRTVQKWKRMCQIARRIMPLGHGFRVLQLDPLWEGVPCPANVWPALSAEDLALYAKGLLFLDDMPSVCWQAWAQRMNLPLRRLASLEQEALCA